MIQARHYAAVFKELDTKRVLLYMKSRGHLSLLPQVVRILSRERPRPVSVTITKKEDPRVVGGFLKLEGMTRTDRTHRRALVNLYQKITE